MAPRRVQKLVRAAVRLPVAIESDFRAHSRRSQGRLTTAGCLVGLAVGDALRAAAEFIAQGQARMNRPGRRLHSSCLQGSLVNRRIHILGASRSAKAIATTWTKEIVLAELQKLADETEALAEEGSHSEKHVRWQNRVLSLLEEVFGPDSRFYATFRDVQWAGPNTFFMGGETPVYPHQLEEARWNLLSAYDELERSNLDNVYRGQDAPASASTITKLIGLAQRRLRKQMKAPPEREEQVQDAYQALLDGAEIPYLREQERAVYSTKTYIPDFTFPKIHAAVEIKLVTKREDEKRVIGEINDDILAYKAKYPNMIFVVYDVAVIRDIEGFKASFETSANVVVEVVKH